MQFAGTLTQRAVVARINRKLAHDGEKLRRLRGGTTSRWYTDLGEWYTIDVARNFTVRTHVDVADLARDLGVLAQAETIS